MVQQIAPTLLVIIFPGEESYEFVHPKGRGPAVA